LSPNAEFADVVLPAATFPESGGTFVNVEGRIQVLGPAVEPRGESRPGWRIARDLARAMGLPGFEFAGPVEVLAELAEAVPAFRGEDRLPLAGGGFLREPDATAPSFAVRPVPAGGPAPRFEHNYDRYQGLSMDREIRSLALIRGKK
jgi:NADH dehydrogenase/NADH:ubiquinone oxidoreductase subunit G